MTRRGLDDSARMTWWGTITTRGWLGEHGSLGEDDSTRRWLDEDDSVKLTRWGRLNETMTRRGWLDEARCVDKDYSMSQGCWQLKGTFVLRILCWKRYLFFSHYFKCSIFIEIMVIYPIFIQLFYFTHQSIVLNTKVSFHFHLYNYYMYKLVSLLDA